MSLHFAKNKQGDYFGYVLEDKLFPGWVLEGFSEDADGKGAFCSWGAIEYWGHAWFSKKGAQRWRKEHLKKKHPKTYYRVRVKKINIPAYFYENCTGDILPATTPCPVRVK